MTSDTLHSAADYAFREAIGDIAGALRQIGNSFYLAQTNLKLRYKRSYLGPLWITLTTTIFIVAISYLYTGFIDSDFRRYLLNFALGWILWQFITDSIVLGAQTFQHGSRVIKGTSIEKFFLVQRTVLTNLIAFGHNLLIAVVILAAAGPPLSATTLLVIPAFALIVLSAVWSAVLFGLLCSRHRDFLPVLQAAMRVLFFVTPILWLPALVPANSPRRLFIDLNPLAHYVEIWRQPLLGEAPAPLSWLVAGGCTVVGLGIAFLAFARYRRNIVFWV